MALFLSKQRYLSLILLFLLSFVFLILPSLALAQAGDYGLGETIGVEDNAEALTDDAPEEIAGRLIGTLLTLSGVIFMSLIFVGGITWMTAQGNEQQVQKAQQMIIAAVFGLLVVLSAYAVTAYVGRVLIQN